MTVAAGILTMTVQYEEGGIAGHWICEWLHCSPLRQDGLFGLLAWPARWITPSVIMLGNHTRQIANDIGSNTYSAHVSCGKGWRMDCSYGYRLSGKLILIRSVTYQSANIVAARDVVWCQVHGLELIYLFLNHIWMSFSIEQLNVFNGTF